MGQMGAGEGAPQISKPGRLSDSSLVKLMVDPMATSTPSGPEVPEYCLPFTVSQSKPPSVENDVTDSVTDAATVMVHCWLLR